MRLFFILMVISFHSLATTWNDLDLGNQYRLTQSFHLPLKGIRSSALDISRGDRVILVDRQPVSLPGNSQVLLTFGYYKCPGRELATELTVVPVQRTSPMVKTVVFLENCELNVYVPAKSYYAQSLFE